MALCVARPIPIFRCFVCSHHVACEAGVGVGDVAAETIEGFSHISVLDMVAAAGPAAGLLVTGVEE